jgi:hypothetical protein
MITIFSHFHYSQNCINDKDKDIYITDRGGPLGFKRLRLPYYLDKRQGCQPYAPAALYPQVSFLRFLVLISVTG